MDDLVDFVRALGSDSLLVQGAGGNASWKGGDTLWVKASGAWLADADREDFIAVDLCYLQSEVAAGRFDVVPRLAGSAIGGRPSIETLLHAVVPQNVVLHLHAVEVLAYLVRDRGSTAFMSSLRQELDVSLVDYHKPGPDLARAVSKALRDDGPSAVLLLLNHGLVIAGDDVDEVRERLAVVLEAAAAGNHLVDTPSVDRLLEAGSVPDGYVGVGDPELDLLATHEQFFRRLKHDWALYPDHVVFLGERAYAYDSWDDCAAAGDIERDEPSVVFILRSGMFVSEAFGEAQRQQLICYLEVLRRQSEGETLRTLSVDQVRELLDWEAERYRSSGSNQRL